MALFRDKFYPLNGVLLISLLASMALIPAAYGQSRIKDLANVEGVRENMLVGYGLVVGLPGTGDRIRNTPFTRESLVSMLERLGVNIRSEFVDTDNIAAVMVTANLPAFATGGAHLDVSVSALGDAESLRGGTLLVTPLYGADNEVYAVAQGSVAVNGFSARGQASSITEGVSTNGRIANGAVVERSWPMILLAVSQFDLPLETRISRPHRVWPSRLIRPSQKAAPSSLTPARSSLIARPIFPAIW